MTSRTTLAQRLTAEAVGTLLLLATVVGSISLTLILWLFGYLVMGGSH